ncbi:TPA: RHS domain-containing protein [Klebsiella aerogenes]|nr:RHS domain-containing protein [Klebsiella aerogenes]
MGGHGRKAKKVRTYWYQNDHLGTPHSLADSLGEVVYSCSYNAYGQVREETHHQQAERGIRVENPLRFQGQYADEESGLHYNRYRYYNPLAGRYISQDPISVRSGLNTYSYVFDPVGGDPLGLKPPKVKGTQKGLKYPDYVDVVKEKMSKEDFDYSKIANQIDGYYDSKSTYHVGDGHHRMAAAIELYKETGDDRYICNLLKMVNWIQERQFILAPCYRENGGEILRVFTLDSYNEKNKNLFGNVMANIILYQKQASTFFFK